MPFSVVAAALPYVAAAGTIVSAVNTICKMTSGNTGSSGSSGVSGSASGSSSGSSGTSGTSGSSCGSMSGLTAQFAPKSSSSTALVDQPTFTDTTAPEATTVIPTMAAPAAVNAKRGGRIGHYDVGGGIPDVSTRPVFARGNPQLTAGFSRNIPHPPTGTIAFQAHKAGGEIHEHRPEFFSEGGLNHTFVQGAGDGTSDSVPAMLANGEFVIPADVVSSLGNGDNKSGAKVMDQFLKTVREHKRDAAPGSLPPDSKGPLGYLQEAKKKAK